MERQLKSNIFYQIIFQLFKIIIPFVTTPIISRNLGVSSTGIYSYCHSMVQVFIFCSMLGISTYGTRLIARDYSNIEKMKKDFWNVFFIEIVASVFSIIIYLIFTFLFNRLYFTYSMIFVIELIGSLLDINWFYFGLEKFKMTAIRNMLFRIFSCIAIVIFIRNPTDLYMYCIITSLEVFFSNSILWIHITEKVGLPKFHLSEIKKHLKPILILFIPVIAATIFKYIDKIMLGFFGLISEVGFYEYIDKINNIPIAIVLAFGTTLMPFVCKLLESGDAQKSKKYLDISIYSVMFFSLGFAFGLLFIAEDFIPLFLGDNYSIIIKYFNISVFTIPTFAWRDIIKSQYLIPLGLEKINVVAMLVGSIINVLLNFILIPILGLMGALIATLGSEGITCFVQTYFIRDKICLKRYLIIISCFVISGMIMNLSSSFFIFVNNSFIIVVAKLIIGGLIYTISSFLLVKIYKIICKMSINNYK